MRQRCPSVLLAEQRELRRAVDSEEFRKSGESDDFVGFPAAALEQAMNV